MSASLSMTLEAPNNSVSATHVGALGSVQRNDSQNLSQVDLCDKLTQLAFYEILHAETKEEAESMLEDFLTDLDPQGSGSVPWRRVVELMEPSELMRYKGIHEMDALVDSDQLTDIILKMRQD